MEQGENFPPGRTQCRICHAAEARARYAADPEKFRKLASEYRKKNAEKVNATNRRYTKENPEKRREWQLRSKRKTYGWEPGRWERVVAEQNGLCAIDGCEGPVEAADHDHVTGLARGALCHNCNKTLGLVADSPSRLRGLAAYIELYREIADTDDDT